MLLKTYLARRRFAGALAKNFEARLLARHKALPRVAVTASFSLNLQQAYCHSCAAGLATGKHTFVNEDGVACLKYNESWNWTLLLHLQGLLGRQGGGEMQKLEPGAEA